MLRVAHISTFPPQRCGIAEYAADLTDALEGVESLKFGLVKQPPDPHGCEAVVDVNDRSNLIALALQIRESRVDVVDLQHEFGIWGGDEGENLLTFLEACDCPIVSTLHTTFPPGINDKQARILTKLLQASTCAVVLTEKAAANTALLDGQSSSKLRVIRHGVPETDFAAPPAAGRAGVAPVSFVSPGFFRPDKGLELVLVALSMLADVGETFQHTIVGGLQADNGSQHRYKSHIQMLADKLNIADRVSIVSEDLERSALIEHIKRADCALLGYSNVIHASSGIIPLVLSTGTWVICPPIEYIRSTANVVPGLIATEAPGSLQLFDKIKMFVDNLEGHRSSAKCIYESTRHWVWPETARRYKAVFEEALG